MVTTAGRKRVVRGVFVVVQHGSHAANHEYARLKDTLHRVLVEGLTTSDHDGLGSGRPPANRKEDDVKGESDDGDQQVDWHIRVWDTEVNNRFATDDGTRASAERLVAQLIPALTDFAVALDSLVNPPAATAAGTPAMDDCNLAPSGRSGGRAQILFCCVGHSYGGVLLRDAIALLARDAPAWQRYHECLPSDVAPAVPFDNRRGPTAAGAAAAPSSPVWIEPAATRQRPPTESASSAPTAMPSSPGGREVVVLPRVPIIFVTYVSIAAPHCGATEMNPILRLGGKLIGLVYSTAYAELMLHSKYPFLQEDLIDEEHLRAWGAFRRRVLCGCIKYDHLVKPATSMLLYEATAVEETLPLLRPPPDDDNNSDESGGVDGRTTTIGTTTTSTTASPATGVVSPLTLRFAVDRNVGQLVHLPRYCPHAPPFSLASGSVPRAIAAALRSRLSFSILPVRPLYYCIAHDAVAGKSPYPAWNMHDVLLKVAAIIHGDIINAVPRSRCRSA